MGEIEVIQFGRFFRIVWKQGRIRRNKDKKVLIYLESELEEDLELEWEAERLRLWLDNRIISISSNIKSYKINIVYWER